MPYPSERLYPAAALYPSGNEGPPARIVLTDAPISAVSLTTSNPVSLAVKDSLS